MKYKELEDCEQCPLFNDMCPGGMTFSPSGNPIEPPCTCWNPDDDLDELYDSAIASQLAHEEYLERKWKEENDLKKKKEEKAKKAEEARMITHYETSQINKLRKRIKNNNETLSIINSISSAMNMTNEMYGYGERIVEKSNHPFKIENEELQVRIEGLDKIRKEKLKQLRNKKEKSNT